MNIDSTDSPDCLPILLSIPVFYFLFFFGFFHFSVVGSVRQIKLTCVSFRAHVETASRVVFVTFENVVLFVFFRHLRVISTSAAVLACVGDCE